MEVVTKFAFLGFSCWYVGVGWLLNKPRNAKGQNDSIVLSEQAVQRGLGSARVFLSNTLSLSLSYHTTRFDIHYPFRLYASHPDIPGGLGVVLPGHAVQPGSALLAAHVPPTQASVHVHGSAVTQSEVEQNTETETMLQRGTPIASWNGPSLVCQTRRHWNRAQGGDHLWLRVCFVFWTKTK